MLRFFMRVKVALSLRRDLAKFCCLISQMKKNNVFQRIAVSPCV